MAKACCVAARMALLLAAFLASIVIVTALFTISAEARHRHHGWPSAARFGISSRDTALVAVRDAAPLGRLTGELIRDCDREADELKHLPVDAIGNAIGPDQAQSNTLGEIRAASVDAADRLASACPRQTPTEPVPRLDAVNSAIDAVGASLDKLEPLVQSLYQSLQYQQKTRLVTRYAAAPSATATTETTGAASVSKRHRWRRGRQDSTEAGVEDSAPAGVWDCGQWEAELRAWPIAQVQQALQLAARQRGVFYELAAALQHAADGLADSCPQQSSLTPIGRLQEMRAKLDALHRSIETIRAPLARFYDALDGGQRNRFAAIM